MIDPIFATEDSPTVTHQELTDELMRARRWTIKYEGDCIHQTATHLLFRELVEDDDAEPTYFWVPKDQTEPVNYVSPSGIEQGAYKFPFKYANPQTMDRLKQITEQALNDNQAEPLGIQRKNGQVIATWCLSAFKLPAPPKNGKPQQYLPCEYCGKLTAVDMNVVSHCCNSTCGELRGFEGTWFMGGRPIKI